MPQPQHDPLQWRIYRLLYYASVVTFFICIIYFGSNLIAFGKLTFISMDEFVPGVQERCVPVVRVVKEFQRNGGTLPPGGHLPEEIESRIPDSQKWGGRVSGWIDDHQLKFRATLNHIVTYRLPPDEEAWYIEGPYVCGRMPIPPVSLGPSTIQSAQSK